MKILFLGTSGGESYPGVWCACPNCAYARAHGGRNLRMNTGTMIDDDILLDLNSCGFHTAARLGVSLTGVKTLLATHPHADHMTVEPLEWRAVPEWVEKLPEDERVHYSAARFTPLPMMTVYGNACVEKLLMERCPELFDASSNARMRFVRIHEGETVEAENLSFTPVRARHGEPGFAHSYILRRGGRTLLYALDTGGYDEDMLELIYAGRYDGVITEGTRGLCDALDDHHMNRKKNVAFRKALLEHGCISEDTPVFLTHMSPHWTPPHDLYAPMMAEEGFTVAYDGMTAEI